MSKYLIFLSLIAFSSCEIINPIEETPSFIYISDIQLDTSININSYSSNISDAWVYVEDDFLGVFPLPSKIPVFKNGDNNIIVEAGIKKNGISASRISYPFYKNYNIEKTLNPNQVCTIAPHIRYKINEFPYLEDFEGNGTTLNILTDSINHLIDVIFSNQSDSVLEKKYGKIVISGADDEIFECKTNNIFLPKDRQVFLELDYKSNATFVIGLYANFAQTTSKSAIIYLNKKEEWNKTYISLSEEISSYGNTVEDYNIFIGMSRDTSLFTNELLIDNLRLVYE